MRCPYRAKTVLSVSEYRLNVRSLRFTALPAFVWNKKWYNAFERKPKVAMINRVATGSEALHFLRNGQTVSIGGLRLEINVFALKVIGWSRYVDLSNTTKMISLNELSDIKSIFADIVNSSDDFREFIAGKILEYNLYFDDGGKCSVSACSEKNGTIKWHADLND